MDPAAKGQDGAGQIPGACQRGMAHVLNPWAQKLARDLGDSALRQLQGRLKEGARVHSGQLRAAPAVLDTC